MALYLFKLAFAVVGIAYLICSVLVGLLVFLVLAVGTIAGCKNDIRFRQYDMVHFAWWYISLPKNLSLAVLVYFISQLIGILILAICCGLLWPVLIACLIDSSKQLPSLPKI